MQPVRLSGAVVCASLIALSPAAALDDGKTLSAAEIRAMFAGASLDGIYASGTKWSETYSVDGTISYLDEGRTMTGTWKLEGSTFCTIYDSETGGCWRVRQTSGNCFEFAMAKPQGGDAAARGTRSWDALGWLADQPTTCTFGDKL